MRSRYRAARRTSASTFVYFSFFLVVSALLLAGLFFRLGVEQRAREVGLLGALGFPPTATRRLLLGEALVLSVVGSVIGMVGAMGYAALIVRALSSWWAVGRHDDVPPGRVDRRRSPSARLAAWRRPSSRSSSACGGWSVAPPRVLLAGLLPTRPRLPAPPRTCAARLEAAGRDGRGSRGPRRSVPCAGSLDSVAEVGQPSSAPAARCWLRACWPVPRCCVDPAATPSSRGAWRSSGSAHGARVSPGRAVLSLALIAGATFIIVGVTAFRRKVAGGSGSRASGTGGFALMVETLVPVMHDPQTPAGRTALGLDDADGALLAGTSFVRLSLRPGDDASCVNLYRPSRPRIVGVPGTLVGDARFHFAASLAETDAERANPWRLLDRRFPDGRVPAIVDATSLTYVFHSRLGDDLTIENGIGRHRDPAFRRLAGGQCLSVGAADLRRHGSTSSSPPRPARACCSSRRPSRTRRGSRPSSSGTGPTTVPTSPRRPRGWPPTTAWRTPTSPRSRRWAGWDSCWARSAWRWSSRAMSWSASVNWPCCARWATRRGTCDCWWPRRRARSWWRASCSGPCRRCWPSSPLLRRASRRCRSCSISTLLAGVLTAGLLASWIAGWLVDRLPLLGSLRRE